MCATIPRWVGTKQQQKKRQLPAELPLINFCTYTRHGPAAPQAGGPGSPSARRAEGSEPPVVWCTVWLSEMREEKPCERTTADLEGRATGLPQLRRSLWVQPPKTDSRLAPAKHSARDVLSLSFLRFLSARLFCLFVSPAAGWALVSPAAGVGFGAEKAALRTSSFWAGGRWLSYRCLPAGH